VLRGVSPLIWRRLLVPATTTIADLHAVLQAAFGWADEHLHRFVIHGREYGISYPGGVGFRDNPRRVSLAGFGLRAGERFGYDYDFIDGWRHDLRVEQLVPPEPGRSHPVCTGGRRAGPPEDCGGAWAFLDLRQRHSRPIVAARAADLLRQLLDAADDVDGDDALDGIAACRRELAELQRWLTIDRFDRRAVNRRPAALSSAVTAGGAACSSPFRSCWKPTTTRTRPWSATCSRSNAGR
jgi:hypothetical protein